MTVAQLIDALREFEPDVDVFVDDDGRYRTPSVMDERANGALMVIL